MKPLLLGLGLQGKATLHDLERSPEVERVTVADLDRDAAAGWIAARGYRKASAVGLDATDPGALAAVVRDSGCDVVICLLPATFNAPVARAAILGGVPFVSTSYTGQVAELDGAARERGVTVLPEMGFDPGIDLLLARLALDELEVVEGLYSYGAGVPEPSAADNPLRYKITWTFDGVLRAYKRDARMLRHGRRVEVPGAEIFRPEHVHTVDVPGVGTLEAYPNGDAIHYAEAFALGDGLAHMGRFAMRWPGHAAFWNTMAGLGFLDDEELDLGNGARIAPRQFLVRHLTPRLQFRPDERDVAILRVDAWGRRDGRPHRVVYDLVDRRDLETGLFAMNRTVGYTASIAAHLVARGEVGEPGVLSPTRHVPAARVVEELDRRGVSVTRTVESAVPEAVA